MEYTLEELASKCNTTGRSIRYYIAEKLMPGPVTQGRGAIYLQAHLDRLLAIESLRKSGYSVPEIRRRHPVHLMPQIFPEGVETIVLNPSGETYEVASDVTVVVKNNRSSYRKRLILRATKNFSAALMDVDGNEQGGKE